MTKRKLNAFTLIELLVVIGILAILLTITLIAINPAKQFAQSNDTRRRNDVNTILNAIHQYSVDNKGNISALGIPVDDGNSANGSEALEIGYNASGTPPQVNLCSELVPEYISALPVDPTQGTDGTTVGNASDCSGNYRTGYRVVRSNLSNNIRITVSATAEEPGAIIEVTR